MDFSALDEEIAGFKIRNLLTGIGMGSNYLQNRRLSQLMEENMRLNALAQKRALNLPQTTEDYEQLTNDGPSFVEQLMPSMAKRGFSAIPGPISVSQRMAEVPLSISSLLPSKQTQLVHSFAKKLGGNRYGRAAGAIGRAIFSL